MAHGQSAAAHPVECEDPARNGDLGIQGERGPGTAWGEGTVIPVTVTKADMERVFDPGIPGHFSIIMRELVAVFEDDGRELTLDDVLRPFENKPFTCKVAVPAGFARICGREVRYSDYLYPLFYAAAVVRQERAHRTCAGNDRERSRMLYEDERVIKEVLGLILKDFGHFKFFEGKPLPIAEDGFYTHWDYWGYPFPKLTKAEQQRVNELYASYLLIVRRA